MECPFCHADMNKGTIHAYGPVGMFWLKEGDKISVVSTLTKKLIEDKHEGVVLADPAYFKTCSLVAYIPKLQKNHSRVLTENKHSRHTRHHHI